MRAEALAATVAGRFADRFGRAPDGVWAAPGRVNLIGEHTDYNDGFVLPFALDRCAVAAVAARDDDAVRLLSLDRGEATLRLADVRPGGVEGWPAYVAGPLWALADAGVGVRGVDVALASDVPVGSGLSSSAAVECAIVSAGAALFGGPSDAAALARLAQRAENHVVGAPTGIMDQMASLASRAGHALLLDTRSMQTEHEPLDVDAAGLALLVIDTRAAHSLVDGAYAERRAACEAAAAALGVPALRDADLAALDAAGDRLDVVQRRRAHHVVTENARVLDVVGLLRAGALRDIGPLLTASHVSLRDDYEVSSPELDAAVDAALSAGALGARMTGAGFGGCAIALVPAGQVEAVGEAVASAFAARGFLAPSVFAATPSDGARRIA